MAHRDRLIANVLHQQYLEEDEFVVMAVSGQTGAPRGLLGGFGALVGEARPRHVIVTRRNLYVLNGSWWSTTKATGVVAKHALGDVVISKASSSLLTVNDETIFVTPSDAEAKVIAFAVWARFWERPGGVFAPWATRNVPRPQDHRD